MIKLIDSHCHLQDPRIIDQLPQILERAWAVGVKSFICCGSSPEDWPQVQKISELYPGIIPAYGLHPWYVVQARDDWQDLLRDFLAQPNSIIGETGLDLKFTKCSLESQESAFRSHMELAVDLKRPVSTHCVKAWHRMIPILKEYNHPEAPVQLHSYNGGSEIKKQLAGLNVYFSFSGSLTRSRNQKAHKAVRAIPLDRLLIESDAPDIPPEINGTIDYDSPNEPRSLKWVLETMARLVEQDSENLAGQLMENTANFLGNRELLKDRS